MKTKLLLLIAILIASSADSFAQSVKVTPRKTTYTRKGADVSDYKKTFTVTYPKVAGAMGKKIEAALSYEKNFDLSIKEELGDLAWLSDAYYKIGYNNNGLLSVALTIEGSGAYPSVYTKYVVVDQKSGSRVKPADVFSKLNGLAALVKKAQDAEIKKAQAEYKKDPESADFDGGEYFGGAKFTTKELEHFSISGKGITFHYDYGFPHVVLALQPDGEYFYSWKELKLYIKKDGIFSKFN